MFNCNNLFNLFANDTTALTKEKNIENLSNFINYELQKLGTWLKSNELAVNTGKTKIMIFYPKGKLALMSWLNKLRNFLYAFKVSTDGFSF